MRRLGVCIAAIVLSLAPATVVVAQYSGTDARYAQERRSERSNRRLIRLGISGVVLLIGGGAWVAKKMRGSA